ncbi:hypothetical protein DPSP01_004955 [Paraphaeosphaeria sporulosa]
MVSLPQVLASNAHIATSLPPDLVAVFAGATTGIGRATLKAFVKYAVAPRIYLFARNTDAAAQVVGECTEINPKCEIEVIKVDLSSMRETEAACEVVLAKEQRVNLLVLSMGEVRADRALSNEGLHLVLATVYYARILIPALLLPLLTHASTHTPLARVLDIAGGTKEGPVDLADLAALRLPMSKIRGQLSSMHTLSLESLAERAPMVSFVHEFPGAVVTPLFEGVPGWAGWMMWVLGMYLRLFQRWVCVPLEECAERQVFLGTSAKYAAGEGDAGGVELADGVERGQATEQVRSCVYSVDWDGEGPGERVLKLLKGLRREGVREVVWEHTNGEFERIRRGKGF